LPEEYKLLEHWSKINSRRVISFIIQTQLHLFKTSEYQYTWENNKFWRIYL